MSNIIEVANIAGTFIGLLCIFFWAWKSCSIPIQEPIRSSEPET